MPTVRKTIGTTAQPILQFELDSPEVAKVIFQNIGASNLYWGHDSNVTAENGHYLPPNAVYTDDLELEPVWIVSDVAGGVMILTVQKYLSSNVTRIVE